MNGLDSSGWPEQLFVEESSRQHFAEIKEAVAKPDEASREALEELWARRAAKLARAPITEDSGEKIDLVLIRLGLEIFGLFTKYVTDIQVARQITPVPRVPDWVAGVVNLRGRIRSVVDLHRLFNLPATENKSDNPLPHSRGTQGKTPVLPYLVVVETPDVDLVLLVNEVLSIESVPIDSLQDVSGTVRGLRPKYVLGVADHRSDNWWDPTAHMVVLDLPALLADERLIIHEEVL